MNHGYDSENTHQQERYDRLELGVNTINRTLLSTHTERMTSLSCPTEIPECLLLSTFMCMNVFLACVFVLCVRRSACKVYKGMLEPLVPELSMVVSVHVGTEN